MNDANRPTAIGAPGPNGKEPCGAVLVCGGGVAGKNAVLHGHWRFDHDASALGLRRVVRYRTPLNADGPIFVIDGASHVSLVLAQGAVAEVNGAVTVCVNGTPFLISDIVAEGCTFSVQGSLFIKLDGASVLSPIATKRTVTQDQAGVVIHIDRAPVVLGPVLLKKAVLHICATI